MMNNPFVREQAVAAARHMLTGPVKSNDLAIVLAFRQTLGRDPTGGEMDVFDQVLSAGGDKSIEDRWVDLYQILFASLDFRYCD